MAVEVEAITGGKRRRDTMARITAETRAKISASMKAMWARRLSGTQPTVAVDVYEDDARYLARYAPTSAKAVSLLLEAARLLDWRFDPAAGRWRPRLPKAARAEDGR